MRRLTVLFLALLTVFSCSEPKLKPVELCGLPCYPAQYHVSTANTGVCHDGRYFCETPESEPVCINYHSPDTELCDGLDNDCDGKVDENLVQRCHNACGSGDEVCVSGEWLHCNAPQPAPEICDSRDNDCDGYVDEVVDLPVEFCYESPTGEKPDPETLRYGLCHPGIIACVDGRRFCSGAYTPLPETCDRLDNNCDGSIDENLGDRNVRFALVTVPAMDDAPIKLETNLTDGETFNIYVAQQRGTSTVPYEFTLDAIMDIASDDNPLNLAWNPANKRVILVFADEDPQSNRGYSREQVAQYLRDRNYQFFVWTESMMWSTMVALVGNGNGHSLRETQLQYLDILDTIVRVNDGKLDAVTIIDNSGSMPPYLFRVRESLVAWSLNYPACE